MAKSKADMTQEELREAEEKEFQTGPLSVLTQAVKGNSQVRIQQHRLILRVSGLEYVSHGPAPIDR
jgi:small nuclear ribonucleoprotein D2